MARAHEGGMGRGAASFFSLSLFNLGRVKFSLSLLGEGLRSARGR